MKKTRKRETRPPGRGLRRDDSAVSAAFSYVLMFAIATILFTSIMLIYSTSMEQTRERAVREELTAVGVQIAQASADLHLAGLDNGSAKRRLDLPNTVAGETYTVELNDTLGQLVLTSATGVEVRISLSAMEQGSDVDGTLYSSEFESSRQGIPPTLP